jgi:protein SCO1/2
VTREARASQFFPVALAALLALATSCSRQEQEARFKSGVFDPPREAPSFQLDGSDGSDISLDEYRGKVVAIAFGFSHCPRVCPVSLAHLSEVAQKLGAAAKDLQVLFITVDPERDNPARLREFLDYFNPAFRGATGKPEKLSAVEKEYGVIAERVASQDAKLVYEVHHSSSIFLIDRSGRLRVLVPFGRPVQDLLHDVQELL